MAYYGSGPQWQPPPGGAWQPPPPGAGWPQPQPVDPARSDTAYRWFRVYAGVMTALYLVISIAGLFFLTAPFDGTSEDVTAQRVNGAIYGFAGLLGLGFHAVALFLPRRPWAWIYGIVVIAIGMTSCCILPAAIPLLIAWLKPEMKARFNRT